MVAHRIARHVIARPGFLILFLVYAAFIALGLPDGLFGVAWPTMRKGFGMPIDAVGLAMVFGTTGYLLSSFLSGCLIARLSINGLLVFSCALTGVALLAVCLVPSWIWFAILCLALGWGGGGIDAGLNTYVAARLEEKQMHWLHASYGAGVTLGPLLMTAGLKTFGDWRPGYLAVAGLQMFLAAAFVLSAPTWRRFDATGRGRKQKHLIEYSTPLVKTLAHGPAWTGFVLFFLYSGAEIGMGFWAYTLLTEARGVAPVPAGVVAGGFYAMFTVGRILSGFLTRHLPPHRLVSGSLGLAVLGSLLLWANLNPAASLAGMVLTGFAIAPVFPALVSGTASRVGRRHAANAIGIQMSSAGLGSAVLPALLGVLARRVSVEAITGALLALFIVILMIASIKPHRGTDSR